MELDTEKFAAVKELAELQQTIANARVELKKAQDGLQDFLALQKVKADETVATALLASREAIAEAESNHSVVASLLGEANAVVDDLKKLTSNLETKAKKFKETFLSTELEIKNKVKELTETAENIKIQRRILEDDQKNLAIKRKKLDEDRIVFDDRWEMLEQDIKRLQKVKL